jgi:hypothetical protein
MHVNVRLIIESEGLTAEAISPRNIDRIHQMGAALRVVVFSRKGHFEVDTLAITKAAISVYAEATRRVDRW